MTAVTLPEFGVAGIADSNLAKHPGLDELFTKALLGELPRSRALKPWEPDKLNETHLQIILLRAAGMRQRDIAAYLNRSFGLKLTDATVSICCNHPDAVLILSTLVSYAADNVTDIGTRVRAYAAEALDRNVQIMRQTRDEKLAARIGFDFLDRAGYGAVQKQQVDVTHSVVADKRSIDNLAAALRDTQNEVQGDYVLSGDKYVVGEGAGNPLDDTESQVDSGLPVAVVPPNRPLLSPKNPDFEEDAQQDSIELRKAKMRVA